MQPASNQLLNLLLQNDSSFSHHERQIVKHLIDGSPLPAVAFPEDKRLVPAKEVCRRLGCGKTHFYSLRDYYRELAPIDEFGPVVYRLDWVLSLLDRVGTEAISRRFDVKKGAAPCLSN